MSRSAAASVMQSGGEPRAGERMLVGIVKDRKGLSALVDQGWYYIPMPEWELRQKRRPRWIAAFETIGANGSVQCIRYYGRIARVELDVPRRWLFPGEPGAEVSTKRYARLWLERLEEREAPIIPLRKRRNPFIATTWKKFANAEVFSDLFHDSTLEDRLWRGFRRLKMQTAVERQWEVRPVRDRYYLDFAVFCEGGNIDVETDGDATHLPPDKVKYDKARDRDLAETGWRVLRYSPEEIEHDLKGCLSQIAETVVTCGGLEGSGLAPKVPPARPGRAQGRLL